MRIAHERNLEPTTPEEVRQVLELRGRNKGEKPALLVDTLQERSKLRRQMAESHDYLFHEINATGG